MPRSKKTTTKGGKKTTEKEIKKVVQNEMKKQQNELKQAFSAFSGNSPLQFNSGINSTGDMLQVLPYISRGTGTNERIGDQITAKSLIVQGYVRLNPNTTINDQGLPQVLCRLMIVSLKYRSAYPDSAGSAAPLSGLLKKGGTSSSWSGVISDVMAPINTELFTVHSDQKFYLSNEYIYNPTGSAAIQIQATDVRKGIKFFKINVKCKNKKLYYDSNVTSGSSATNFAPMLLLGYTYLNGNSPDTISTNLGLVYSTTFNYTDN